MFNEVRQRKTVKLQYRPQGVQGEAYEVTIDSEFESGNLGSACFDPDNPIKVDCPHELVLKTEPDCDYRGISNYCRSWFYFRVRGFPRGACVLFVVGDINLLSSLVLFSQ